MKLETRVAWAGWDEHRFMGRAVFGDLAGRQSFASLCVLAVTGRAPTAAEVRALDALAGVLSVADPRIWPLKLVRVGSSTGRVLTGLGAGLLAIDSDFIGPWTAGRAAADLVALRARLRRRRGAAVDATIVEHFADRPRIIGFGVPFRDVDERVFALRAQVRRLGRSRMPYWSLAERVWATLERERGDVPNIGSAMSAMLLDVNIPAALVPTVGVTLTLPTLIANAVEGAAQAPAILRALPAASIDYTGPRARSSPRAVAARRRRRA